VKRNAILLLQGLPKKVNFVLQSMSIVLLPRLYTIQFLRTCSRQNQKLDSGKLRCTRT